MQELSIDSLRDHFGLDGPQLENALTTGGWAWSPVVEAGRVKAYRVSRIWCEAWIPFVDFRGVQLGSGDATWLPLGPRKEKIVPRLRRIVVQIQGLARGA